MATLIGNMSDKQLMHIYEQLPIEQIHTWMQKYPLPHDPFSNRSPTTQDKLQMTKDILDEEKTRNYLTRNNVMGSPTIPLSGSSTPMDYFQHIKAHQNIATRTGTISIDTPRLNEEIARHLREKYPKEEKFLRYFAKKLNLSPIEAIVECIKTTQKYGNRGEPTTLNKINQELERLEREKSG